MLHSISQQIWKTQQWPQDWKRSVFIPIPKKGSAKEYSNYCTIAFMSHASKVMLKILQARLEQYVSRELPDVQAGFRKGRGTRDQIANIHWITEKTRESQENTYLCFTDSTNAFDCVDHNKLWKILKEMGIPDHLTCILRNVYASQEATIRTLYGTMGWFKIGKCTTGYKPWLPQGYILSPCLFNIWRAHHVKCQARWIISWNQDCWEKYQQPQICRWYHSNDRKWRRTKEPLDEGERGEWKSWLKTPC